MAKKRTSSAEGAVCPPETGLEPQTREGYVDNVLEQIGGYEERLDQLESDMESSGWDDTSEFRSQLDDLRVKLRGLRSQAQELEAVPDRSWSESHEEMESLLADVAGAVEDLASGLSLVLPE